MPRFVVFWTISTIKDEKSVAKFHYIKTASGKVVAQSIAFRVVSIYWQGTTPSPEILPPSDLPSPVNGILGEMSELITQEWIAVGSSSHVIRHVWPLTKVKRSNFKVTRSSNVSAAITVKLGIGWSYQLQTWWKLSPQGAHYLTHFLVQ